MKTNRKEYEKEIANILNEGENIGPAEFYKAKSIESISNIENAKLLKLVNDLIEELIDYYL